MGTPRFPNTTTLIVVVAMIVMPFAVPATLASQIAIFATAALSVTLLLGGAGLLSFGQGLYLGIGAYIAGLLLRDAAIALLPTLFAATLGAAAVAAVLGAVMVRRQGIYFVMLTLAFAQMGYFAMLAAKDITGGENGLSGLPRRFDLFGATIASPLSFYVLSAGVFSLAFLAVQRLLASPFGSVLTAIRENEGRSEAMGYNVKLYKIAVIAVAGGLAGLAGSLHAVFLGFVPPNDIELEVGQRMLVMSIIGGIGSPGGALVGSAFYALVSEALSELWARWMALIALVLIALVLFLPGGLWSVGHRLSALRQRKDGDG